MKLARTPLLLSLLVFTGLLLGGAFAWRLHLARAEWERTLPEKPDLTHAIAEFREQVDAADKQVRRRPHDSAALAELTFLYLANGFDAQAVTALRLLAGLDPKEARWQHLLARQLGGYGDIEAALPWHARAVALAPDYLPARIKWADALVRHNEIGAAAEQYRAVLTRKPDQSHALVGLARIDFEAGRLPEARSSLERAIAADPTSGVAHNLLSTLLDKLGDHNGAAAERAQSSKMGIFHEIEDPWSDDLLAYCYDTYRLRVAASALGFAHRPQQALAPLKRAAALKPDEALTHALLGRVYCALNDFSHARPELERAIALDPKAVGPYLDLVRILKIQGNLPDAIKLLTTGLQSCPDSRGLHYEYALVLAATDHIEESLPHLRDSQRLQPDDPAAYQEYAVQCFRLGRDAEGAKTLEAALVRNPQDGPILTLLVRYHIHVGHVETAQTYYRRAREAGADPATLAELEANFRGRFGHSPDFSSPSSSR